MSDARLKYKVVKCGSEDPDYPVSELLAHSQQTKGWQTAKFCEFPQELGLQFETPVHLRQVQFLSHQSKIATKIELFTALPAEGQVCRYESAQFKRLGYLSLDNNERSQFQARELKSVYVDVSAQFLRILLHKCHLNRYNTASQVGLMALNCLGESLGPDLAVGPPPPNPTLARGAERNDPQSQVRKEQPATSPAPSKAAPQARRDQPSSSPVPSKAVPQARREQPTPPAPPATQAPPTASQASDSTDVASDETKFDQHTFERIRSLDQAKQRAVEVEDYEEAKRCKEMLNRLKQTAVLLRDLEERKKAAVQNEDYDAAKGLKVEIDKLRKQIENPQAAGPCSSVGSRASSIDQSAAPVPVAHDESKDQERAHPSVPQRGAPSGAVPGGDSAVIGRRPSSQSRLGTNSEAHTRESISSNGLGDVPTFGGMGREGAAPVRVQHDIPPQAFDSSSRAEPSAAASPNGEMQRGVALSTGDRHRTFDQSGHPLRGVPNVEDLGPPDPLSSSFSQEAEPLQALFGDYVTRCVYSKSWNLRDSALQKCALDVRDGVHSGKDPSALLHGFATILRRTIPDKNVQVYLSSANLQQTICQHLLERGPLRRPEVQSALDPLLPLLVERLGDANPRVEKTVKDALLDFARCQAVGAQFTTQFLLRPPKKKNVHHRVYSSRLQVLASLAAEVGVQSDTRDGIQLEPTVHLAMEWFSNPNAEVRESAVKLVAACYAHVGLQKIEKHLSNLRPAQREVFDSEFEKVSHTGSVGGRMEPSGSSGVEAAAPQAQPSRRAAEQPASTYDVGYDDDEDFVCHFCGRRDMSFTQEGLDIHYWRECPMLIECDVCKQVIEISTFRTHLREECEKGAIARAAARDMQPNQCPLCRADVGRGEDADWWNHLLRVGCARNPRDKHRGLACLDNLRNLQ